MVPVISQTDRTADSTTTANQNQVSSPSDQSNQSPENGSEQPAGPVRPNISELAAVLVDISRLNQRLRPQIERYADIVRNDEEMSSAEQQANTRMCSLVSETMHALSHAYHSVSDLMVDLTQPRPRQLYVTLAIAQPHTAVIQRTIPVQAQIQIGGSPRLIRRQFAPPRLPRAATDTSSSTTPISVAGTGTQTQTATTASTGTSTVPPFSTAGTGTQTSPAAGSQQSTTSTQPAGGSSDNDFRRIQEQMSAGIQSLLGGQGPVQGNGTPDNPFVFVEMGPDSMTVNSISAEVVSSDDLDDMPSNMVPPMNSTAPTGGQGSAAGQGSTPGGQSQGFAPGGPNDFANMLQNLIQQSLQGQGQANVQVGVPRMQIQMPGVGRGVPRMEIQMPGVMFGPPGPLPPGVRAGTMGSMSFSYRPGVPPRNESATQTQTGQGASSATQTSSSVTSVSGTQTTSGPTPSNTSGTQTPGMGPAAGRTQAFMLPGMPALAQNVNPVDSYLPCSSRHFLSQHAQEIVQQGNNNQTNEMALADMVSNLMAGLLGGEPTTGTATSATSTATSSTPTSTGSAFTPPSRPPGPRPQVSVHGQMPQGLAAMFPGSMRFRTQGGPPMMPPFRPPQFPPMRPQAGGARPGTPGTTQPGPAPTSGTEPPFLQMLRTMLSSAATAGGNQSDLATSTQSAAGTQSTGASNQSTSEGGNQSNSATANQSPAIAQSTGPRPGQSEAQPISDEAFTQLVSGITNYMSQAALGQAPRQTISDFLSGLGQEHSIPQGEGFLNEIMSCVLSSLQITDLLSVFYGQPTPLNQVQAPLREFLGRRVLNGAECTPDNVRSSVEDLVESMETEIADTVSAAQCRPHIDFLSTLNRFLEQHFFNLVTFVMNSRESDPHFGQDLYASVRRFLSELFVLCSRCLGGITQVEALLRSRLAMFTTGVNPLIQQWMVATTTQQFASFIPTITVSEGEVAHFLVYQSAGPQSAGAQRRARSGVKKVSSSAAEAASSASTAQSSTQESLSKSSATPKASVKRDSSPLREPSPKRVSKSGVEGASEKTNGHPMETSPPVDARSPGAAEVEVDIPLTLSPAREIKGAASTDMGRSKKPLTPVNQPTSAGAQSASDGWESVVPSDWVPVIMRDIETQRGQAPQRPHSDVYMQGVPPKRRKMMADQKPGDLSNPAHVLPDSIRQAVAAAAVEPISSLDNLTTELASDSDLHDAFEAQLSRSLAQRLDNDTDYKSNRFPNTEEYYHKSEK
ncbi:large proline-rich protein BAG6-like [Dreissena polymorpha]|nr:large proline-rich protein BAG6-like [Dreissena polymorpha]